MVTKGLLSFHPGEKSWSACAAAYRIRLFVGEGNTQQSGKAVLDQEKIKAVIEQGGEWTLCLLS